MATTSKYVTRDDLSTYTKQLLSLISQRDTKINTNKDDISAIKQALENIDAALHYVGDTSALPTTADDGALYSISGSATTAVADGWYFYSTATTAWKNLISVETEAIHFDHDPWD